MQFFVLLEVMLVVIMFHPQFEGQKVGFSRPSVESSPIAVPMHLLDKASMREIVSSIMMAIQPLIVQAVTAAVTSAMEAAMNQLLRSDGLGSLKSQTQRTHFDLDRLEQYGRRESIRIHGVEEKAGENTNESWPRTLEWILPWLTSQQAIGCQAGVWQGVVSTKREGARLSSPSS